MRGNPGFSQSFAGPIRTKGDDKKENGNEK
jgi:hypothetical protein